MARTDYEFTIGNHNEQAHEYVSTLIDEAYSRKTTPAERSARADELCEACFEQVGDMPAGSVLTRLAWYLVFDEMTDKNEHKVMHTEYPILSEHQLNTREKREHSVSDMETGAEDETLGRRNDSEGISRRIYDYMTPERDMSLVPVDYLDLYDALDNAGLTRRQRQAIDLVYFDGLTQELAAEEMGVSRQAVGSFEAAALVKLSGYMSII